MFDCASSGVHRYSDREPLLNTEKLDKGQAAIRLRLAITIVILKRPISREIGRWALPAYF